MWLCFLCCYYIMYFIECIFTSLFLCSPIWIYMHSILRLRLRSSCLWCFMEDCVEDHFIGFPLCIYFAELLSQIVSLVFNKALILWHQGWDWYLWINMFFITFWLKYSFMRIFNFIYVNMIPFYFIITYFAMYVIL